MEIEVLMEFTVFLLCLLFMASISTLVTGFDAKLAQLIFLTFIVFSLTGEHGRASVTWSLGKP